ncbi:MAG TPA: hypothetical protein ACHBX6_02800 [Arsenophonus nasoniae]|uniref:hypothetical protein n=1 Tax=Arsenophonus nasoniae TaxID=638 RepID=UPI00387A6551
MKNCLKILSITCCSLIQAYSFANVTTSNKNADEYIYHKHAVIAACHYDDKIGEKFCWDKNGLVDNRDINILATDQSKQ